MPLDFTDARKYSHYFAARESVVALFQELEARIDALPADVEGLEELETAIADLDTLLNQRTVVSVKEHGALGDGSTNDTAAFQAAIDAVAVQGAFSPGNPADLGGIVFVPDGSYKITNIEMKSRVSLVGASKDGTVISHIDGVGHTGAMITLSGPSQHSTGQHNFTLIGGGDADLDGISYTNIADINAAHFLDVSDAAHHFSNLEIYGFDDGIGINIVDGRALQARNIRISHCRTGVFAGGSDCKWHEMDINWCGERGFVANAGNPELSKVKCWYIGTDNTYDEGDAFVINASRAMLTGCQAQDVSRHGLYINNADNCIIRGMLLDNIGNFNEAQSQGIAHPAGTNIAAVYLDGTATYNSIDFALAQRSAQVNLNSLVFFGASATNNAVYAHRNPAHLETDGEDVHNDGGSTSANANVVHINGKLQNVVVSSIAAGSDDGIETVATGAMTITGTNSGLRDTQYHFFRFEVPDLPQGCTIESARIQFSAAATGASANLDVTFVGEDADTSATLTTDVSNISSRPTTTATVTWEDVPAWTSGDRNLNTLSPDLSTIVQEIVDRAGFAGAIGIRARGSAVVSEARAWAFLENTSNLEATLTVIYTT